MSNLQKYFGSVEPTDELLRTHVAISRYGSFALTDAVRPSYDLAVVPRQGYRRGLFDGVEVKSPVIVAAASKELLLELFLALLDPLGMEVDVVLETSHGRDEGHDDLLREEIDLPVLKSIVCDFED